MISKTRAKATLDDKEKQGVLKVGKEPPKKKRTAAEALGELDAVAGEVLQAAAAGL